MPEEQTHDLYDFLKQLSDKMAANYKQIQKRATEDPGPAGDQGEENWAELLRGWLPRTYEVVTKGRIIGQDGRVSPQVDVLVLKSIYPKQLIDEGQKIFLAAGVAAAFECKTTLKAEHIEQAVKTCVEIKNLYPDRMGTPYKELHAPIVYGLLAHSHSWKGSNSTPETNISQKLFNSDKLHVTHPRECLDYLCVADLATWTLCKISFCGPQFTLNYDELLASKHGPDGFALSTYMEHAASRKNQVKYFTPVGVLISLLTRRLAWENQSLRELANYYMATSLPGSGQGTTRSWSIAIYSEEIRQLVKTGNMLSKENWHEWSQVFY